MFQFFSSNPFECSLLDSIVNKKFMFLTLLYLMISNSFTEIAFDRFLKTLLIFRCINDMPSSHKMIRRFVTKNIFSHTEPTHKYYCHNCCTALVDTCKINTHCSSHIFILDIISQMKLVLFMNLDAIKSYQLEIMSGKRKSDFISRPNFVENMKSANVLHIHLLMSTDGGEPYTKKKITMWPFYAIILDLPSYKRFLFENTLLLGLWFSLLKPNWNAYLKEYINGKLFETPLEINNIQVVIHIVGFVFDLPAVASIINHKQYNGEFGCHYCEHPGRTIERKHGYARIYSHSDTNYNLKTSEMYAIYARLAEKSKVSVFGIKGSNIFSEISFIKVPDMILIDVLHLFYKNCSKKLLVCLFSVTNKHESFFIGSAKLNAMEILLADQKMPHNMPKPLTIKSFTHWKGHDFKNFILYLAVPYFLPYLNPDCMMMIYSLVIGMRLCSSEICLDKVLLISQLFNFYQKSLSELLPLYMNTINVHLLGHVSDIIKMHGSVTNYSMFCFEARLSNYKKMMKGTHGHPQQIVQKFLDFKTASCFLQTTDHPKKVEVCKALNIGIIKQEELQLLNPGRLLKHGIVYHSKGYGKHNSYTCQFGHNKFGIILDFPLVDNVIHVQLQLLNVKCKLVSTFGDMIGNLEINFDDDFFFIVEQTKNIVVISADTLVCKCILIKSKLDTKDVLILTPLKELFEYA
nr:uncharacterized protein LOC124819242 isoform X1 [Hydra vulgaris]